MMSLSSHLLIVCFTCKQVPSGGEQFACKLQSVPGKFSTEHLYRESATCDLRRQDQKRSEGSPLPIVIRQYWWLPGTYLLDQLLACFVPGGEGSI